MYRKNTAGQFIAVQLILTATGAVATGLSPAARRCIDGTFAAGGGTFTEDGTTGSYKYALAQADTNGNDISIIVTATGAIPVVVNFVTTAADPTNAATFGITDIDATISSRMATYTQPTGFLAATFPAGTIANQTNITGGTLTTVTTATNLTNAPTAGDLTATMKTSLATAVWTDTTAGDFTTALSVGKSVMNGVTLGTGLTINGYTGNTPQTGDAFARLGAPAGASHAADVAAVKSDTGTILTDVNTGAGAIYTRIGAPAGASIAADIAAVKAAELTAAQVATGVWQDATAGDFTAVGSIGKSVMNGVALGTGLTVNDITTKAGYSLTQAFPTNFGALGISAGGHVSNVDTLATYTGNTVQTGDSFARLGAPTGASIAADIAAAPATLLDQAAGVETNRTLRQSLRLMLAVLAGKASGLATATAVYRDTNDTKNRISATVDVNGNRTAVTLDAS